MSSARRPHDTKGALGVAGHGIKRNVALGQDHFAVVTDPRVRIAAGVEALLRGGLPKLRSLPPTVLVCVPERLEGILIGLLLGFKLCIRYMLSVSKSA